MSKFRIKTGFTLVELVVVIAVLAILAGVGAVAYNGYIEHAKKAGDLELLGAVNEAFSSACAEYNIDRTALPNGGARLKKGVGNDTITGVDYVYPIGVTDKLVTFNQDFSDEFLYVFEPNDDVVMQYYKADQIRFDGREHMFVFVENGTVGTGGIFEDSTFAGMDAGAVSQSTRWGSALIESLLKYDNDNKGNEARKKMTDAMRNAINGNLDDKIQALFDGMAGNDLSTFPGVQKVQKSLHKIFDQYGMDGTNPSYTAVMNGLIMSGIQDAVEDANLEKFWGGTLDNQTSLPLLMGQLTAYYNSAAGQTDEDFKKQYNELFQIGEYKEGVPYTGGVSKAQLENLIRDGTEWSDTAGWKAYLKNESEKDLKAYIEALKQFSGSEVDLESPDMFGDFLSGLS